MTRSAFYELCESADFSDIKTLVELERAARQSLDLKVILMQWKWHHERGTPRPMPPMEG